MINFTMNNGLEIPAIGYGVFMSHLRRLSSIFLKLLRQGIAILTRQMRTSMKLR